jgi:8-oxo-dGTP diphosphatase
MTDVVCAIMVKEGRVLIARRGDHIRHPWKWEFPGGKVQPGETLTGALKREIREELNMEIEMEQSLCQVEYYEETRTIRLIAFLCRAGNGIAELSEHTRLEWVHPELLITFDLLPADRELLEDETNFRRITDFIRQNSESHG